MKSKSSRRSFYFTLLATAVCAALASFVVYQWTRESAPGVQYVTIAGESQPQLVTSDMSVAEAGRFSGPKYLTARQQHLANRASYDRLDRTAVPAEVSAIARAALPTLRRALGDTASDRKALIDRRLPRGVGVLEELTEAFANLVRAAAGGSIEEYVSGSDAELASEFDKDKVAYVYQEFDLGTPPQELRRVFGQLYDLNRSYNDGENIIRTWSLSEEGFVAAAGWCSREDSTDLLYGEFKSRPPAEADRAMGFWTGRLVQGGLQFTNGYERMTLLPADETVLVIHVIFIGGTRNDSYPLECKFWYDTAKQHWQVLSFARRSSIRAGNNPPFAY